MICAARGYRVKLCLPRNASEERKKIMNAFGVDLVLTDPGEGSDGAIRKCREIYEANPDIYFYPDQYSNPANWQAHFETTGPEIIRQTEGRVTHFISAMGTATSGNDAASQAGRAWSEVYLRAAFEWFSWIGRLEAYADGDRAGDLRSDIGR